MGIETKPEKERTAFERELDVTYVDMQRARTELKSRCERPGEPPNYLKRDFYEFLIHLYGLAYQRLKTGTGEHIQLIKDMNAWDANHPTRNKESINKGVELSFRLQEALYESGVIG